MLARIIRAPVASISCGVSPLTVAAVPTGMKVGVSMTAVVVRKVARRAFPSVAFTSKAKPGVGSALIGNLGSAWRLRS